MIKELYIDHLFNFVPLRRDSGHQRTIDYINGKDNLDYILLHSKEKQISFFYKDNAYGTSYRSIYLFKEKLLSVIIKTYYAHIENYPIHIECK